MTTPSVLYAARAAVFVLCAIAFAAGCASKNKSGGGGTIEAETSLDQSEIGVSWMRPKSQVADLTYAPRFTLFSIGSSRLSPLNEMSAWERYCDGRELTDREAAEVQATPMPSSLKGRCGALK